MKLASSLILLLACVESVPLCADTFGISFETLSFDYREYDTDGTILDSEKSDFMPGIRAWYSIPAGVGDSIEADFSWFGGDTDYVGFLLGSGGSYGDYVATTNNTLMEGSLSYSTHAPTAWGDVFMSLGAGYRYWERALADGHTEEYIWPYGKLSLGSTADITADDTLSISASYQYAFDPKMESNVYGTFDLGTTDGIEITVPWRHRIDNQWSTEIRYTYSTWEIGRSDVVGIAVEPDSKTVQHRGSFALVYQY